MFKISNFTDNDDVTVLKEFGAFKTIEWKRDLSVNEASAMNAYFASEMNVRRRQVICDLSQAPVTVQAGAMQWMVGNVTCTTGVKGVGDLFGKALRGAVTSESAIKPEYQGTGLLVLEPTYRYIITLDVADWGNSIVLDDGLFLACYSSLQHKTVMRSNVSSAVAGNEGLFNLGIQAANIEVEFQEGDTVNVFDRAVAAVAPVHAAKRAAARAALKIIDSGYGNYGANLTKKSMRGWMYHGGSAKEDIEDNIDILRQRSRDAYMGIPTATAALKTMRTNVVAGGLMPALQLDSDYLGLDETAVEKLQAQFVREFALWADTPVCDAERMDNFYQLQQLAFLSYLMNGDTIALLPMKH